MGMSNKWMAAAAALVALAACSNDENLPDPFADGPVALAVSADISPAATRASGASFGDNDQIGIFAFKEASMETAGGVNTCYTYNSGNFTANPPYYFQDRENVTFKAYYPYDNNLNNTNHTIAIDTRATNQTNMVALTWRKNDYLFATNQTSVSSPSVSYTGGNAFSHVMSQVVFTFKAGTSAGVNDLARLTGYKITTVLTMDGSFDPTTGAVRCNDPAVKETITMAVTGAADTEITATPLILLPQEVSALALEVTYNGQTYKATLDAPEGSLKSGYSYSYTVTINNTGLTVGSAQITGWQTGFTGSGDATMQ